MLIDRFHVFLLGLRVQIRRSQQIFQFLFRQRNAARPHLSVQAHVFADPSAIQNHKSPEAHRLPLLRPLSDAYGSVLLHAFSFEFQE